MYVCIILRLAISISCVLLAFRINFTTAVAHSISYTYSTHRYFLIHRINIYNEWTRAQLIVVYHGTEQCFVLCTVNTGRLCSALDL